MPDLMHSLQGRDLEHLRIVANLWGIQFSAPDAKTALPALVTALLDRTIITEVVEALSAEAQSALYALLKEDGRMSWAIFTRRFGPFREMGAARRDRERPYLTPISTAEILWYRALIARSFFATAGEPQEFAYIPDDLIPYLPALKQTAPEPMGRPASPLEITCLIPAKDLVLDHSCTLLAALKMGISLNSESFPEPGMPINTLQALLADAHLLDASAAPIPEPTRNFLEAPRGKSLLTLFQAWIDSPRIDDLRQLPEIVCEGEWRNNPLQTRTRIIEALSTVPEGIWWSIKSFVDAVHERMPDFQRTGGEYDSWFIRLANSQNYLRGFTHWEDVEGALIRYLICGPLHWLGIFDLAAPAEDAAPTAFCFSGWSVALLSGRAPGGLAEENAAMVVTSNGELRLPALTPRAVRYLVARFCMWGETRPDEYRYQITPSSLVQARRQGLRLHHLKILLKKYTSSPIPPVLIRALNRWEINGIQSQMQQAVILKLASKEILAELQHSSAARFLGEPLGPTSVIIKPGAEEKVIKALVELGYLTEDTRFSSEV